MAAYAKAWKVGRKIKNVAKRPGANKGGRSKTAPEVQTDLDGQKGFATMKLFLPSPALLCNA